MTTSFHLTLLSNGENGLLIMSDLINPVPGATPISLTPEQAHDLQVEIEERIATFVCDIRRPTLVKTPLMQLMDTTISALGLTGKEPSIGLMEEQ
jgi:hypothetical protein